MLEPSTTYLICLTDEMRQVLGPPLCVELPTDSDAFLEALQMVTPSHGADVWRNDRLIVSLPPAPAHLSKVQAISRG